LPCLGALPFEFEVVQLRVSDVPQFDVGLPAREEQVVAEELQAVYVLLFVVNLQHRQLLPLVPAKSNYCYM
jgi:hypothetical protein